MCRSPLRVEVIRQDGKYLAGMLGRKVVPELVNALLGRLLLHSESWANCWSFWSDAASSGLWSGDINDVNIGD
jgi:hypothetical protein